MKDLRPIIERNQTNGLSQAEEVRDRLYEYFTKAAEESNIQVLILKSPPFAANPWIRVECWIHHNSDSALTLRSNAELSIRRREFYRYPSEIDIAISDDKKSRKWSSVIEFNPQDAKDVLQYLASNKKSLALGFRRCRVWPFQLWLSRNKPARLGSDPMSAISKILIFIGLISASYHGVGVPLLLVGGIISYTNTKRRHHVLCAGKPGQEPRQLIRLDSWQTFIRGLGSSREIIVADIMRELTQGTEEGLDATVEKIWHWGVDGKEEREQLVVRFRRGMVFVTIYSYGSDLFVGWDAHVNCGIWNEKVVGRGYDKSTKELCVVHTIEAGWHVPNEYDINDTNCLLERVHAAVTKIVKLKLFENHIDQEIDFKILREQRQNIVGRGATGDTSVKKKFRRIG